MPARGVLQGDLGLLSLFDLGQLLMLNGATGELTVTEGSRRGFLYFDRGSIVNAVDDQFLEGEGAAYRLFAWRQGHFEFVPGPATGQRAITENTEGLMMEAARRMDEAGIGPDGGVADKLAQRASSLEALREAFQSVASETAERPEIGPESDGSAFELLREPADALLFRPGQIPRMRSAGRWRNVGKEPLDASSYAPLRARLLESPQGLPGGAGEAGARTRIVTLESGRRYAITHLAGEREALWVRAAALTPPTAARLDGDVAALDEALGAPAGLLLVSAPDAATAERFFHACVARLVEVSGATVLLLADHDRWLHADRAGAIVRAGEADALALARASGTDVAAYDLAHARFAAHTFGLAPRTVAAVVSPDAGSALARWCAGVGRRWGDGIETHFAGARIHAAHATTGATIEARLPFAVTEATPGTVVPVERTDAAAGELAAGALELTSSEPEQPAKPASGGRPRDAMAALAAELGRTLRKAA